MSFLGPQAMTYRRTRPTSERMDGAFVLAEADVSHAGQVGSAASGFMAAETWGSSRPPEVFTYWLNSETL